MESASAEIELKLVHEGLPGLSRAGTPGNFSYTDAVDHGVGDAPTLERIRRLAIPPAWTRVWIATDPDAHLQATGIDSRGRKQYRYHPAWREDREHLKFDDMQAFARAQPPLRRRIDAALNDDRDHLGHRRVHALALRLLDVGLLRVGSDRYARDNQHYGLTTLRRDQVSVSGGRAVFDYVGKAGKRHRLAVGDPQSVALVAALKRRRQGPVELLVFNGKHGWTRVHREDVNNFLRAESGGPFSAKEYRTWNASVIAAATLAAHRPRVSRATAVASAAVAEALGNTPTIARKSYIDPRVFERFASGRAISLTRLPSDPWLARARIEHRVLDLLAG